MKFIRSLAPEFLKREFRLAQTRSRNPRAAYIRSSFVHRDASLGDSVGVAEDVVINASFTLGKFTYVNRGALLLSGEVGAFCSIGHYAIIGGEEHPTNFLSTSPLLYGKSSVVGAQIEVDELALPPVIENDVWIGARATVLQGVNVGNGAIIGAGAVVTRDVEPYSIVAGVPARPLSMRFDSQQIALLQKSKWWELDFTVEQTSVRTAVEAGTRWSERWTIGTDDARGGV